jgi:diaminopimelate decarboxylase
MTLAELLPTFRSMLHTRLEQGIWPRNTTSTSIGDLIVGGVSLSALADKYGTPLHVLDEAEVRVRCRDYRLALPDAEIMHADDQLIRSSRTVRCLAVEGMALAVGSGRGVALARAMGLPAQRVLALGGRADDLGLALAHGCGRVVVGTARDVHLVARLADGPQEVLVDVVREDAPRGGGSPIHIDHGKAMTVVRRLLAEESLRFAGLRLAVAPGTTRIPEFEAAARRLVRLMIELRDTYGVVTRELGIAGEHVVRCREQDGDFDLGGFAMRLGVALRGECATNRMRPPRLLVEPGRALTARAGVALRRVMAIAEGRLVIVDGAVGGRWVRLVGRASAAPARFVTVVGRDGSVLDGARLPDDVRIGDLLAIPCADVPADVPLVSVAAGSAVLEQGGTVDDIVSAR